MTVKKTEFIYKQNWMSKILDVDRLRLTDIVWPCTHNDGMDKKAPDFDDVTGNWTTCQSDSFAWQLANGARALDIRLEYAEDPKPVFYFQHNGHRSGRVLDELIEAVLSFLDDNPDEFLVLDFHELRDGSKPFDYKKLNDQLVRRLGMRVILPANRHATVGELKRSSTRRRIVMAAQFRSGLDDNYFWPRIPHKWRDSSFTSSGDLRTYIAKTLKNASYDTFFWSLSATAYTLFGGPRNIKEEINDWFNTTADWVTRCSIINTDFFDTSEIVRYCWSASSMKAVYGPSLHKT
ncbi:phospholipase [Pseudomonas laurylsulfatiphila]